MTLRRRLGFAVAAVVLSVMFCAAALLAVDTWVHHKFDAAGGLNRRGYRGPVVGTKKPGEWRVVVIGGSTALGYGLPWQEAFPAQLEMALRHDHPASVINLGWNSEGAFAMRRTLEDYGGLGTDLAILYEGYNDLATSRINTQVYRRESVVFRLTGYYPLLPLVVHEKVMALQYGGNLTAAYKARPTVFRPTIGQQAAIGALTAAEAVADSLTRQLGRLSPDGAVAASPRSDGAQVRAAYVEHVSDAVRWARAHQLRVIVVGQPFISDTHVEQQTALAAALSSSFGTDSGVRYVGLGRLIDLHDRTLAWDGMHLTAAGNARVAQLLAPVVTTLLQP
jgi:lysophospholipase L1-like esterase